MIYQVALNFDFGSLPKQLYRFLFGLISRVVQNINFRRRNHNQFNLVHYYLHTVEDEPEIFVFTLYGAVRAMLLYLLIDNIDKNLSPVDYSLWLLLKLKLMYLICLYVNVLFPGVAPPTFVAVQAGQTLHTLTSSSDAWSWMSVALLSVFACISLIPVLMKNKLREKFE